MEPNKKLLSIQKDLLSSKEDEVLKALKEVKEHGSPAVMPALIKATLQPVSPQVFEEGKKILNTLKDNNCVDAIMESLKDHQYAKNRSVLAASLWEAGLTVDDRLIELVEIAVESDYLTAIEITTIIENIETGFPFEEVTEAAQTINEHVEESDDDHKNVLLLSLAETLNGMVAG